MYPGTKFCFLKMLFSLLLLLLIASFASAATVQYAYDSMQRLVSASYSNGAVISYTYDELGNRLTYDAEEATPVIYDDGEDGSIVGWDIYDNDPSGAVITNIYDDQRSSRVIELTGASTANGYRLRSEDGSNWDNTDFSTIEWSSKYDEYFTVYVAVQTKNGFRYLYYTPVDIDELGNDTYIHHGLGSFVRNGEWQTFYRDLSYDLKDAQPDNELISVLAFLIRGSGRLDDIKLRAALPHSTDSDGDTLADVDEINMYGTNPYSADSDNDGVDDDAEIVYWGSNWNGDADNDGQINILDEDADNDGFQDGLEIQLGTDPGNSVEYPLGVVYEDAEDENISGWSVYDNDPVGALINNVHDTVLDSRVIEFTGSGTANGYQLYMEDGSKWNDELFKILSWDQRFDDNFTIYVATETQDGFRYIHYTSADNDNLGSETYIHHGLGSALRDGNWHSIVRDLEFDLKEAQPDNELLSVLGFLVRGNGRIDNVQTLLNIPADQDSDDDGILDVDEINTYGTHPYYADSDADGFTDGEEIDQGTDPLDVSSYPSTLVYEDAEHQSTVGWDIYDNDPSGASIQNIFDNVRQSRVIEFTGSGTSNGYQLRNSDGSYWTGANLKVLEWSMQFSEYFIVYIAVQSKDGFRYLEYTPGDTNRLGDGEYIHHGLGSSTYVGDWLTIERDLELDLKEAQPDNELESILGFLIRGSGRLDDIKAKK